MFWSLLLTLGLGVVTVGPDPEDELSISRNSKIVPKVSDIYNSSKASRLHTWRSKWLKDGGTSLCESSSPALSNLLFSVSSHHTQTHWSPSSEVVGKSSSGSHTWRLEICDWFIIWTQLFMHGIGLKCGHDIIENVFWNKEVWIWLKIQENWFKSMEGTICLSSFVPSSLFYTVSSFCWWFNICWSMAGTQHLKTLWLTQKHSFLWLILALWWLD